MRVGPSKEYGDTPTITLRFRTLGMTLSRGKSPQAGRNNLLSPRPAPHSLKQCSFSFIIDPSVRPLARHLFFAAIIFISLTTPSLSLLLSRFLSPSPSTPAYRRPRPVYSFEWYRPSPSNLIHFSFSCSPRALVLQDS